MENQAPKQRNRIILVNRDFQFRYTGAAILVGLLSTVLTTTLILFPLYQFEILRIPRFLPIPILTVMGLAGLLNIGLVGFMGILLTHRIAGPMYSLVRHFRRIEDGRWYGQMRVREGDDMKYLVRNFNAMLESINHQSHMDFDKLRLLRELLVSSDATDAEKVSRALIEIKSLDERLRERLHANHDDEPQTRS